MGNKWSSLKSRFSLSFFTLLSFSIENGLSHLIKICVGSFCFCTLSLGGYFSLMTWFIPYYKSQELSSHQEALEENLRQLPHLYLTQWQTFERQQFGFHFTIIKIKTVFHTLLQQYGLTLKDGQIQEQEGDNSIFSKQGKITLNAKTDKQIFDFLQHLNEKLTGILNLKVIKIHRAREVNDKLLAQIRAGMSVALIEADIEFEWLIFKENK